MSLIKKGTAVKLSLIFYVKGKYFILFYEDFEFL